MLLHALDLVLQSLMMLLLVVVMCAILHIDVPMHHHELVEGCLRVVDRHSLYLTTLLFLLRHDWMEQGCLVWVN